MTNDQLADAFRDLFDELHAKIDALPDSGKKVYLDAWANVAHGALERLKKRAVDEGDVSVESGGDPKPE
jgi:hypothetical protein